MATSIRDNPKKKRGRPATGKAPLVGVRITEEFQASIKAWAKKEPDQPALAPAIRRLIELGLAVKHQRKQAPAAGAVRAKELAAKAIDKMSDEGASPDDQAHRKRRLLKGPEEFRDARVDRAKAKP
jgi:hypothetical protein